MIFEIFVVGLIASFINAIAGGGGAIISIPFLIFLGLPPHTAIATNRFGALGMGFSSVYKFFINRKIVFHHIFPLSVFSIIGSLIGANILVRIDNDILTKLMGVLFLFILPFILLNSETGVKKKIVSRFSKIIAYLSYFFISVYDSFFGVGSGLLAIFVLSSLLGITYTEANATEKVSWILNAGISVIIFASFNLINYKLGIMLMVGMLIGGYLGASVALKGGDRFVKIFLFLVALAFAIKLIFD